MARSLTAYLERDKVPARGALQAAIKALGFPLTLDDDYAPFETSGYLPAILDGEDAGFNLRFMSAGEAPGAAAIASAIGERDAALSFKWSGDPREEAAARAVCAALAASFGASVQEGEADILLTADALIAKAKAALEE